MENVVELNTTEKKLFTFVAETKAVDVEQGIFEAMISTEALDRDGDVVMADGAKTSNFMKNPVVLFGHDYREPPVAKALTIEILPGRGVKSTFQFPEWGTYDKADVVRRLWAAGYLNAISIGFKVLRWEFRRDSNNDAVGYIFLEWELLEYSIVPVPANQDALRLAMKGLGLDQPAPPTPSPKSTSEEDGDETSAKNSSSEPNSAAAPNNVSDEELAKALEPLLGILPELKEVLK